MNPRLFRKVIDTFRKAGIAFEVPDSPDSLSGLAIVDEEFVKLFGEPKKAEDVIVVKSVNDVDALIWKVLGVEEKSVLVGVDVGAKIAYAIIKGNVVIEYGKVSTVKEFRKIMSKLLKGNAGSACFAGVGVPASPELKEIAYEISEALLELGCDVKLTEEFRSSSERPPPLVGSDNVKDSDIRAAINLALRW